MEGLNFNVVAPFKFQDYVFGFRYALGNLKKLPESLFASKTFDTIGDGQVTVDADFAVDGNILSVDTLWKSDKYGVAVSASGDNLLKLKDVALTKHFPLNDKKITISAAYDVIKKNVASKARLSIPKTIVDFSVDSAHQDPVLAVTRAVDDNNDVIPSIALRSGAMSYGYRRKWSGGSLLSTFYPGKKVTLDWKDEGVSGNWVTSADVPIGDTKNTKVSIKREWNY
jgi:hypothetical protein